MFFLFLVSKRGWREWIHCGAMCVTIAGHWQCWQCQCVGEVTGHTVEQCVWLLLDIDSADCVSVLVRWQDTLWNTMCVTNAVYWQCWLCQCVGEVTGHTVVQCVWPLLDNDSVDCVSVLVRWQDTLWYSVCDYCWILTVWTVSVCWWGDRIHCGTVFVTNAGRWQCGLCQWVGEVTGYTVEHNVCD